MPAAGGRCHAVTFHVPFDCKNLDDRKNGKMPGTAQHKLVTDDDRAVPGARKNIRKKKKNDTGTA